MTKGVNHTVLLLNQTIEPTDPFAAYTRITNTVDLVRALKRRRKEIPKCIELEVARKPAGRPSQRRDDISLYT